MFVRGGVNFLRLSVLEFNRKCLVQSSVVTGHLNPLTFQVTFFADLPIEPSGYNK